MAKPFHVHMTAQVLVVDDSLVIRQMVTRLLTTAGFAVTQAKDGADALEKLGQMTAAALVVCDVNMPNMSGLELLEELRVARKNPVPFVMLTTETEVAMAGRAKALGANGWLVKPVNGDVLVNTAKKLTAAAT